MSKHYFLKLIETTYLYPKIKPILKNLDSVEILKLTNCQLPTLPEEVYEYKDLKILKILLNNVPITLDERFCELTNLEELYFNYTLVNFPDCLHKLDKVKKITCVNSNSKNEKIKYHFPKEILKIPNLEQIRILSDARLEMPPPPIANHPLKIFTIETITKDFAFTFDRRISDGYSYNMLYPINLDNLLQYPNLEIININSDKTFFYSEEFKELKNKFGYNFDLGNKKFYTYAVKNTDIFLKKIKTAYKKKNYHI